MMPQVGPRLEGDGVVFINRTHQTEKMSNTTHAPVNVQGSFGVSP